MNRRTVARVHKDSGTTEYASDTPRHTSVQESEQCSLALYHCPSPMDSAQIDRVFCSTHHWLHPLFELEEYLAHQRKREYYILYDSLIGLAASYLIVRMRIPMVITKVCAEKAYTFLHTHGVQCIAATIVSAIGCRTEQILDSAEAPSIDQAHRILVQMRNNAMPEQCLH